MLTYLHRQRAAGVILLVAGVSLIVGVALSSAAVRLGSEPGQALTVVQTRERTITIRLPGKVIRRVDHVLVVQTPRYVFVYRGRRHVLRPTRLRIHFGVSATGSSSSPPIAAVLGIATSTPETVTVPVTIPVPGSTETVTSVSTSTVTSTVIVPPSTVTSTVSIPLETSSARRSP